MTQTNLKKSNKTSKMQNKTFGKVSGKSGSKKSSKAPESKPVKKPTAPKMPGEWLYLNKEELSLRKIYELFEEKQTAEYWEAAGVLEISLPESGTLDMEDLGIWRGNPRPFNDRDESAACFFQRLGLFQAWSFSGSEKRNCLKRKKQLQFG